MADNPLDGRHVSNSPVGIGDAIITADMHGKRSLAVEIHPVYNDGVTQGWVYKSDHGENFYQQNAGTKSTWSATVGAASFSAPSPPPVKLEPGPVAPQLPSGSEVRPSPSVEHDRTLHLAPGMAAGKNFGGSPYALGDDIPTQAGSFTRVTDINVVADKDSGLVVGYLYKGEDDKIYGQRVDPVQVSASIGNVGVTPAGQKAVLESDPPGTLHYGMLEPPPRNDRIPMSGDKPLGVQHASDLLHRAGGHGLHAALPEHVQGLKDGQTASGTLLGTDQGGNLIVNGGRVAYSVPADRIPAGAALPNVGDQVSIALAHDGGPATLQVANPAHDQGVARA